jgi:copper chaperone CopZ
LGEALGGVPKINIMKTILFITSLLSASILFAAFTIIKSPQHVETATFKVSGNCGMCKKTIEGSLKGVKGISSDTWEVKTKQMTVAYDPHLISLAEIHQKIAAVGYDTDKVKANEEAYKSLPICCQYTR